MRNNLFTIPHPVLLECGETIEQVAVRYETYGTLNQDKSNAIYICHALSGSHHAAGYHTEEPKPNFGWWEIAIGPGKPIDTDRFFVVCANNLGGCHGTTGPSSINPRTNEVYGASFPFVTIGDWVNMQRELMAHLGVEQWFAVIGGSLGGMQALQWSISYPTLLKHCVLIASSAELSTQNIAFNEVARNAIKSDSGFCGGDFLKNNSKVTKGLKTARMLGHITYLSSDNMSKRFGRALVNNTKHYHLLDIQFEVERYLHHQGDKFPFEFDANTYLIMSKALDYFDPSRDHGGSLSKALAKVQAQFFICSLSTDWRFPPYHSEKIVSALTDNQKRVSYAKITSTLGHDDFLVDNEEFLALLMVYLKTNYA